MAKPNTQELKQRASMAMRTNEWVDALLAYRELESLEPSNPIWPERQGEVHANLKQPSHQIKSLLRAADGYVEAGEVIKAIAACKQVIDLEPDHPTALSRLDLLYMPSNFSVASPAVAETHDSPTSAEARDELDAPLDELLLTEAIPGVQLNPASDGCPTGIHEIPIDNDATCVLDLHLPESEHAPLSASAEDAAQLESAEVLSPQEKLARTPLFGSLDSATMARLIKQSKLVHLREGDVLFRQGDPAKSLYVIIEGAVIPIADRDNGRHLNVLEEGEFFGEIGIVTNERRTATIRAMVDTRLLEIDRSVIHELVRIEPEIFKTLLRFFRERLIDMQIKTSPFFTAFVRAERSKVARQFGFLEIQRGTQVVRQGEPVEGLYVILSGQFDVVDARTQTTVGSVANGDLFGGLPLVERAPALASVVATKKSWVLLIPESRFRGIADVNPGLEELVADLARDWDGVTATSAANY
jgi:CRP-like cAMP-binding protein